MSPRLKLSFVFSSTLLTLMLVVGAVIGRGEEPEGAYRSLKVYTEVLAHIRGDYVEEPNLDRVTEGALQGLVEYLDPLSSYLTPSERDVYDKAKQNPDEGSGLSTGMVVQKRFSYSYILSVFPDSPAHSAGLRPGDLIEAIDGQSTRVMPPAYLRAKLSGKPGSRVRLLVRPASRTDEPQELNLTRAAVELPPVESRMIDGKIGFLKLRALEASHAEAAWKQVQKLRRSGLEQLIVDLRGNAWGDAEAAYALADKFLSDGETGSLQGQRFEDKKFAASKDKDDWDGDVLLVTDRVTAGPAELFAAALTDNDRCEVVGERTYALAAFQEEIPLDDGAALVLSVAKYHRPSGESIQEKGIEPDKPLSPDELRAFRQVLREKAGNGPFDREFASPMDLEGSDEDAFLQKALRVLRGEDASDEA